jgi:NodT family efflux transporter outer membrane factor (OMF) lipoprotein
MKTTAKVGPALGILALAAGCALGPDYERPVSARPQTFDGIGLVSTESSTIRLSGEKPLDRWWESFHDEKLNALVADARRQNLTLRAALARVRVSRSLKQEAFAPLLPSIDAGGEYSYLKQSPNGQPLAAPAGSQIFAGSLSAGYELDLWGRVRRGLEASEAEEAATIFDKRAVETTVVADVTESFFDLGEAEALLAIAREAVELRQGSLDVVRGKVDTGLATDLDLRRAEGELATTRALVPEYERRHAVASHRLAVLLGHPPDVSFSGKPPAAFDLPPVVPVGLPATLLERRPDVRAAEEHVRAANARIGAAIAEFFPKVTIVGQLGYASLNAGTLANPHSQLWSIGPNVDLPIFSGGLTYARTLEAEAHRDEATAVYLQTILGAFREVADSVSGIAAHEQVRDRQREAAVASEQSVVLATNQYERGLTNYLNVLDAQRSLLGSRQSLVESERVLLSDIVQLQRALGGGWTEEVQAPAD